MASHFFLVPVLDKWLFYAPLHGTMAVVNEAAARAVRANDHLGTDADSVGLYEILHEPPAVIPQPLEGDVCPSFLGIIPTRGCNIGCVYCNFGGPTAQMTHMRPDIAVSAVDWMAERLQRSGRKIFQVHFFGGEPLVSQDIVDIVVHRARYVCAQRGLIPYIDASTNGIFNEAVCRFVGDYFGGVVLSFDGFAEFHDRNRPAVSGHPTFAQVERTARRLSRMPLDLCIRICITEQSVSHLEDMTQWMCREFQPAVVNFESLTPGDMAAKAGLRPPDPYQFARHCVGAYRVAERMGIKPVYSAAETELARLSFCPVGTDALIVSLDGRISACYLLPDDWRMRGLDMDLGWVRPDGSVHIDFEALTRARRFPQAKPRCQRCFCQWSCAGGCHVNQTFPGCDDAFTDFCIQTRIITACLLLRKMGCEELVDALLADRSAMEQLALHGWDALPCGIEEERSGAASPPPSGAAAPRPQSLVATGMTLLG